MSPDASQCGQPTKNDDCQSNRRPSELHRLLLGCTDLRGNVLGASDGPFVCVTGSLVELWAAAVLSTPLMLIVVVVFVR
jgi:hypothetical protein